MSKYVKLKYIIPHKPFNLDKFTLITSYILRNQLI